MTADADKDRAQQAALEKAASDAHAQVAAERAKRDAAEQAARDAIATAEAETARRKAAERQAADSNVRAEESEAKAAESAAKASESAAKAASEHTAREAAEGKLRELSTILGSSPGGSADKSISTGDKKPSNAAPSGQSLATTAAPPKETATPTKAASAGQWAVPIAIFAAAGLLFWIISGTWTSWENTVSVKTDDAYVRSDVAPLSTKASGIVKDTKVNDFQTVKAGDVLVELKDDEYEAKVEQSKAAIRQVEIKITDMKERKEQQDARVSQARAALENSRTNISQVQDTINSADASLKETEAGIDIANAAILQSEAASRAAAADVKRAMLERQRQEALLAAESTTREKVEQVVNEHERAVANLVAQKAAQTKSHAELAARKAQMSKARQQLSSTRSELEKSKLLVQNQQSEVTAQIKQRELLNGEEQQLLSDLTAKKAALISAKSDLDYTTVKAPTDGVVGELKVKPGQLVSAGTQVITVISAKPWVIANYRETQLVKVKEGDSAEVAIDALPGTKLKAHVERIAPASGAQFSLLPPDNASGNFTKITQRIPVKISFDEDKAALANLRPGMSATVTILPGSKKE